MEFVAEFRDPVHGFIPVTSWELKIINSAPFQRLRRIRQLAWTDMVYPGAMHTRFEHSLGVMHVAYRLFEAVCARNELLLKQDGYDGSSLEHARVIVRLAALLHDIGHSPFSHGGEELFPYKADGITRYSHEEYSGAVLEFLLREVIEEDKKLEKYRIKASDIRDFFSPHIASNRAFVLWKTLVAGQMDADRMDYLLRDSLHSGVSYGKYDLDRIVQTVTLCKVAENGDDSALVVGIEEGGTHAIEGLILARYMMFTQVYFHKTRVIYDYHLTQAMKFLLKDVGGYFLPPTSEANISDFVKWDDWRVLGKIKEKLAGEHGELLESRDHYREVYQTPETPDLKQLQELENVVAALKENAIDNIVMRADKSWYKLNKEPIYVRQEMGSDKFVSLHEISPILRALDPIHQARIYVPKHLRATAQEVTNKITGGK